MTGSGSAASRASRGRRRSKCRSPARKALSAKICFSMPGLALSEGRELAKRILEERFRVVGLQAEEVRIDFVGLNAIHGGISPKGGPEPYEIAVRVAARTNAGGSCKGRA